MRVIIVDDDPIAQLSLQRLCEQHGNLELIGQALSGAIAIEAIRAQHPDLLLLDAELGDMTGFDVLRAIGEQERPFVIMVTVHPQHALQAFEADIIDYLTKPVAVSRFAEAIERVRRLHIATPIAEEITATLRATMRWGSVGDRLLAENGRLLYLLDPEQVDYVEADGNYVQIHVGQERYISRNTMRHLRSRLGQRGFLQIERSLLINLGRVAYMERIGQGEFAFTMHNGERLVSSRSHRRSILRELRRGS